MSLNSYSVSLPGSVSKNVLENCIGELSFDELKALSSQDRVSACTKTKLERTLNSTIEKQPPLLNGAHLRFNNDLNKQYLRVTHWNIERGFNLDVMKKIFSKPREYLKSDVSYIDINMSSKKYNNLREELEHIKNTDILLVNEADIGINRTDYRNTVAELADTLGAGYAYATEFVEIDPKLLELDKKKPSIDTKRFKGLHGNAIISKFPIRKSRVLRLPKYYDWFGQEMQVVSLLESTRRSTAKATVKEEITTEVRRGGRIALIAEIELPNKELITVVSTHLEDRTIPRNRESQMDIILNEIKHIRTPVILGGDLNSFNFDASPTSVTKIIKSSLKDPDFVARRAISFINPYSLITSIASAGTNVVRKHRDPTVGHVPVLLPNKTSKMFKGLERFKFTDGNHFDSSGSKELSANHEKDTWSNSNQRSLKGFVETLKLERSFKVGRYKIDWFFVKPVMKDGHKKYYPAFGRTLKTLNYSYKKDRISDHNPITVDIIL